MELSETTRFLKGKIVPGLPGPVASVMKKDDGSRVIADARGNRLTLSADRLKLAFNKVLSRQQLKEALSSVRVTAGMRATVMLGGKINGKKLTFNSKAAAIGAARSYYHLAK